MPNLKTDRTAGVARETAALNVRRLMYQPLIWRLEAGDEPGGLRPAFDAQGLKRTPNPLINGMGGNTELNGDFFRAQVLIDQQQRIHLTLA